MEPIAINWAAEAMGAQPPFSDNGAVLTVCTDSRECTQQSLFFALRGEKSDGHGHVPEAIARGGTAVVSWDRLLTEFASSCLTVDDPLLALGRLATAYRRRFNIPVAAITGSVGKTSTRDMSAHILGSKLSVLSSAKNYNNEIGVPITLFGLTSAHEVAVIEMAMRGPGEIRDLASMALPQIAVITNIGYAHGERLGGQVGIAKAKAEILENLPPGGATILPDDLAFADVVLARLPAGVRTVLVGSIGADLWAEPAALLPNARGIEMRVHESSTGDCADVVLSTAGAHHRMNALFAIALGREFGITIQEAACALRSWSGSEGRMTVRHIADDITLLEDFYNAGPESMLSALETLGTFNKPRVAVLGDMRELGDVEGEVHRTVGLQARRAGLRLLITVGELAAGIAQSAVGERSAANEVPEIITFLSTGECADRIIDLVHPGDAVLIKGSRAMQMERIAARLTGSSAGHG